MLTQTQFSMSRIPDVIDKTVQGKYKIVHIIGSGKYGYVFLGLGNDNRLYALKYLTEHNDMEVSCLKKLSDICEDYALCYVEDFDDNVDDKDYHIIVTKFIEGYITLEQYLGNQDIISLKTAKDIIDRLVSILKMIHDEYDLVHRDIKLDNILIHPDTLHIRFIDFGQCSFQKQYSNYDILQLEFVAKQIMKKTQ